MTEMMWLAMALARLSIHAEILEQENLALKREIDKSKGLREVEQQKEPENASV